MPTTAPTGSRKRASAGFTAMEILVAMAVVGVVSMLAVNPVRGMLDRIKLQRSANAVKHVLLNARVRSVANPEKLCGVVFRLQPAGAVDSVYAFLDAVPDRRYEAGRDQVYLTPVLVRRSEGIRTSIPAGYPRTILFRGDGSATASAKIVLTLGRMVDTVDVLASTGRVKVVAK